MKLKAGDVRQDGDEQRRKSGPDGANCEGQLVGPHSYLRGLKHEQRWIGPGSWEQTCLVGHPILASDLMHLEFRRGE